MTKKTDGDEFEYAPERMRRVPREQRHTVSRAALEAGGTKERITIMLDIDVLAFFRERAAVPGGLPYQTQINAALRRAIELAEATPDFAPLLRDERFIDAVAERVLARVK